LLNGVIVGKQQFIIRRHEARSASHVPRFPAAGNSVGTWERDSARSPEARAAGRNW